MKDIEDENKWRLEDNASNYNQEGDAGQDGTLFTGSVSRFENVMFTWTELRGTYAENICSKTSPCHRV